MALPTLVSLSSGEINKFSPTSGHCVKNDLDFKPTLVSGLVRARHCHFCCVYLRNMAVGHVQASRVRLSRWWDAEAELSVVSKWLWAAVQEKGFPPLLFLSDKCSLAT